MVRTSFLLRLDERTHQELRQWASDELRSLNAQIEYLLREAVKASKSDHDDLNICRLPVRW